MKRHNSKKHKTSKTHKNWKYRNKTKFKQNSYQIHNEINSNPKSKTKSLKIIQRTPGNLTLLPNPSNRENRNSNLTATLHKILITMV